MRVHAKSFIFDKDILMRVAKTFEAITEVKVLEDEETEVKVDATEQRNLGTYKEIRDNEQSGTAGQQEQSNTGASNKYTNQDDESDKSHDNSIDYRSNKSALK